MKKIMNQPTDVLAEMIRGIVQANESTIEQVPNTFVVKQKELAKQVSLIQLMRALSVGDCSRQLFVGKCLLHLRRIKFTKESKV